jgi:hypothetical protein
VQSTEEETLLSTEDIAFDLLAIAASRGFVDKGALFVPLEVIQPWYRKRLNYGCLSRDNKEKLLLLIPLDCQIMDWELPQMSSIFCYVAC